MAFWDTVLDSSAHPPPHGRRLVPHVIDHHAQSRPDGICFSVPKSDLLQHGFRNITWKAYANAINHMAHFLAKEIGPSTTFETVLYLGFPDVRAFIALVALIKTGHKLLVSSHHNSLAAHSELIKQTECTTLIYTAGFPIASILEKNRLRGVCLPDLEDLLSSSQTNAYEYTKTFEQARDDPCFVCHAPGPSGMPKPVTWTHWSINTADSFHTVPFFDGRPTLWSSALQARKRSYCGWPLFHGASLGAILAETCFNGNTIVLGTAGPVTVDSFRDMLDYGDIDSASCLPSTIEEAAARPDILEKLRRLQTITFVGGPLSQETGDRLCQHTTLFTLIGSTETNTLVQHAVDREDWAYVCINPTFNGIEMRPVADLFELVIVKDAAYADFQCIFKVYPHLAEFSMQDLYSPHPTKPHLWKSAGRKDDIIVFRNGLKYNPMVLEGLVAQHPAVQCALLVGTGRDKAALIIELVPATYTEDEAEQKGLLDSIWPQVVQANDVGETFGQLEQRYVMFAKKHKPFQISLKGEVLRKATTSLYIKEIDELYASIVSQGLKGLFRTEAVSE